MAHVLRLRTSFPLGSSRSIKSLSLGAFTPARTARRCYNLRLGPKQYPCAHQGPDTSRPAACASLWGLQHVRPARQESQMRLHIKTVWPSGLRRWLQAPVRKGVGSNPTAVIDIFGDSSFEIEVTLRPCPLYGELHVCETSQLRVPDVNLKLRIESEPLCGKAYVTSKALKTHARFSLVVKIRCSFAEPSSKLSRHIPVPTECFARAPPRLHLDVPPPPHLPLPLQLPLAVCLCVRPCVCVCVRACVCVCLSLCACLNVCLFLSVCVCVCVCVRLGVCPPLRLDTRIRAKHP